MTVATATSQLPPALARHADALASLGATSTRLDGDTVTLQFADATASRTAKSLLRPAVAGFTLAFEPPPAAGRSGRTQALDAIAQLPGVSEVTLNAAARQPLVVRTYDLRIAEELAPLLRKEIQGRDVIFTFATTPQFGG